MHRKRFKPLAPFSDNFFNEPILEEFFSTPFFSHTGVDMYEDDNNLVVKIDAPGFSKTDFKISVENDVLNVSTKVKTDEEEKKRKYYRKMRAQRAFSTSMALPVDVQDSKAKAEYKDGVLKIILPKELKGKTKKVEVKLD